MADIPESNEKVSDADTMNEYEAFESIEWIATANMGLGYDRAFEKGTRFLTPVNSQDYKAAYSPGFEQIAFFRTFAYNKAINFNTWDTRVGVMNADGSDLRFLTELAANHVPKWTQDGSHRIIFSRNYSAGGGQVFWTIPDSTAGQEELLTNASDIVY